MAEYEFTIGYKPGSSNQVADFLSQCRRCEPVVYKADEGELHMVVAEEEQDLEPFFKGVRDYLFDTTACRIDHKIRLKVKRMAKNFLVWNGQLFWRTARGPKLSY